MPCPSLWPHPISPPTLVTEIINLPALQWSILLAAPGKLLTLSANVPGDLTCAWPKAEIWGHRMGYAWMFVVYKLSILWYFVRSLSRLR